MGLDNFATGHQRNLDEVQRLVTPAQWARFSFIEGDIRSLADCQRACQGVDYVLHQAALGSVPRSLEDPITTNATNITGFLNMLVAARDAGVKSFTYAASSSTYGDHPGLPKVEDTIGKPLSPYAVTKYVNELYADVFARSYGFATIGLRYFNIFGPRQDPERRLCRRGAQVDGRAAQGRYRSTSTATAKPAATSATSPTPCRPTCWPPPATSAEARNQVYNVAVGDRTTLNALFGLLRDNLAAHGVKSTVQPVHRDFRAGDVRHSLADFGKAQRLLGYAPTHRLAEGIAEAMPWYVGQGK